MVETEQLIYHLQKDIANACALGEVETYSPGTFFYHRGIYSHATSIWSHSPFISRHQRGRFSICAQPGERVRLARLSDKQLNALITHFRRHPSEDIVALERLCPLLERPAFELDGFTACPLENPHLYQYILLFDPLASLTLYDIEDHAA